MFLRCLPPFQSRKKTLSLTYLVTLIIRNNTKIITHTQKKKTTETPPTVMIEPSPISDIIVLGLTHNSNDNLPLIAQVSNWLVLAIVNN
jgi:hypothetical protein